MSPELQQLQTQLTDALDRIRRLEDQLQSVQEAQRWKHLIARPHPWRRQLSLRERRITVGQLVSTVRANQLTAEQAALDLELPLEAIQEALAYYEQNKELIQREAAEERQRLAAKGHAVEPQNLPR